LNDLAAVREAVKERGDEDSVAEYIRPAAEAFIRGNDDRGLLVELRDETEEEVRLDLTDWKIPELVDDDELALVEVVEASPRLERRSPEF
jgi:hypothetical protein